MLLTYPTLPTKLKILQENHSSIECIFGPLEKHFSLPFANLLRRTLLSYTVGHSITAVKIEGISSEFESIPGVLEDTVDILAHLKNLTFQIQKPIQETILHIDLQGAHLVRGEHILPSPEVSVLNKDTFLCTMNDTASLKASLLLQSGTGYYFTPTQPLPKGYLPLDVSFSPIEHVSYRIQTYSHDEEILFHLRTNGSLRARDALSQAFQFLMTRSSSLHAQLLSI